VARVHARLIGQSYIDRSVQKIGETGMDAVNDKLTHEEFSVRRTFARCRDNAGAHAAVNT
jgi:hypothetical protein